MFKNKERKKKKESSLKIIFESEFFQKLFKTNKSEKDRIEKYLKKNKVFDFLFYTDVRNGSNILNNGIKIINEILIDEQEEFYIWSYLQHEGHISLELDSSTRGNFWKWMKDVNTDLQKLMVVGINPSLLIDNTSHDWVWDRAQNLINIPETIPLHTIEWIMVRDINFYKTLKDMIETNDLSIEIFFGDKGIVRRKKMKKENYEQTIR